MRESKDLVSRKDGLWDCTTCGTCFIRCPKRVEPVDAIIGMRSILIDEGRVQDTIKDTLESVSINGNPWSRGKYERCEWAEGLKLKKFSEGQDAQILCFIGCTPSYDPRVQKVARSLVKCLDKAGVNFMILGNEETCCGSEIRGMGELGLFETLKEANLNLFKKCKFERMAVMCPHGYNTFKNEYKLGFEVQHYTQLIAELIEQGRLEFSSRKLEKTITYHDPCFLGKQNGIYDEPRRIITSIPGVQFVEMDRSRERSLCCGGGGGGMWVEPSYSGERLAEMRIKDAMDTGAQIIATACPFCLSMLEDAVKTTGNEEKIEVRDIMELLDEVI